MTHTFVTMEISAEAFDEIASNLKYVGYTHLFDDTGTSMGMEGIVLTRKSSTHVDECEPSDPIGRCNMDGVCDKHRGKRKSSTRVDECTCVERQGPAYGLRGPCGPGEGCRKPAEFDEKDPRATI